MGHSEMLLAVAGLNELEIQQRTAQLASGDWSSFPTAERVAFGFAWKLTRTPARLTDQDLAELREVFGPHRALDMIWYMSWCNYMTRVADSFQLPLEHTNVFVRPATGTAPGQTPAAGQPAGDKSADRPNSPPAPQPSPDPGQP